MPVATMIASPVKIRVFSLDDVLKWGGLSFVVTLLAIGGSLTKQDPPVPPVGWIILWTTVATFWGITALFFRWKWKMVKNYRFVITPPGVFIGWEDDRYCVSPEMVERELAVMAQKMSLEFPKALDALRGCVIFFRETGWMQDQKPGLVARKVSGVQDDFLIIVGWQPDLSRSALAHECAHRVLQVFAGDPVESVQHERLARLGL